MNHARTNYAIDQLREELKEQWREEIVEHVDHILNRVKKQIWNLAGSSGDAISRQCY